MSDVSQPAGVRRPTAIAAAVGIPAAVGLTAWAVIAPICGVNLAIRAGATAQPVGVVAVLATSAGAGLAGWVLLAILRRCTSHATRIWTVIAALVLVVSLAGPLGGVDPASRWCLAVLHILVGSAIIGTLRRVVGTNATGNRAPSRR